jgi:hypothetical protein
MMTPVQEFKDCHCCNHKTENVHFRYSCSDYDIIQRAFWAVKNRLKRGIETVQHHRQKGVDNILMGENVEKWYNMSANIQILTYKAHVISNRYWQQTNQPIVWQMGWFQFCLCQLFIYRNVCSKILVSPASSVYISPLIRYAYDQFLSRSRVLTNKLMLQMSAFCKMYGRYNAII